MEEVIFQISVCILTNSELKPEPQIRVESKNIVKFLQSS